MAERTEEVNEGESADKIRAEIAKTRAAMSETIDALRGKLDPQRLKDEAIEKARSATIGRAQTLAESAREKFAAVSERVADAPTPQDKGAVILDLVKRHPLPAGAAALGVLLLARKVFGGKSRRETREVEYEIRPLRRND